MTQQGQEFELKQRSREGEPHARRSFTRRELKLPKTEASLRAVPLQAQALDALDQLPPAEESPLLFPRERGSYLDAYHFRRHQWRPARLAAGVNPLRLSSFVPGRGANQTEVSVDDLCAREARLAHRS